MQRLRPYPLYLLLALSGSTYADTATDTQTLTLSVPLVALIDVEDISPTFTFDPPTNAGDGFDGSLTPTNENPTIAISSNNSLAKLNVRTSSDLTTKGLQLSVKANGWCGGAKKMLRITDQKLCSIGMLKTPDSSLLIDVTPSTGMGSMIPYGSYSTDIIYTITQN